MKKEKHICSQIQLDCHPGNPLAGVSLGYICKGNEQTGCIGEKTAGDPGQKPSGMTAYFQTAHGFTLIELLVVVLIIGILAAVALPQYQKAVMKSRAVQALLFMRNAGQAMDRWVLENGTPTEGGYCFLGTNPSASLDIDLTGTMECDSSGCTDGTFVYTACWEGSYWNVAAIYKYSYSYDDGEGTGAMAYVERDANSLIKVCESHDTEGSSFCATLCSLDSDFCD